jgi:H+/Cl- antiporter ClcA
MTATLGGTMRAPLTATFFAMELTGASDLLLPLMATCVAAHTVTVLLMRRSILTEKLARRGHHLAREYRVDPFVLTHVSEVMTKQVETVPAGMTTVFGTPVAAIMLAVELLLFEWTPRSFIPVAVAAMVAEAERTFLQMPDPLFPFTGSVHMTAIGLLAWLAIGAAGGLLSAALTKLVYASEDLFSRLPIHWMWWPALGGIVVGAGGLIDPRALSVGYASIEQLISGHLLAASAVSLLIVKAIIWSVALGSGTSGGVLAPLLIIGGSMGALLVGIMPAASPGFWPLLAMTATLGGTMRAPLPA